jgi:hypothetical protein
MDINAVVEEFEKLEAFLPYITLFLLLYAVYKSIRYAQVKSELESLQAQMDRLLLRERAAETAQGEKADLYAEFVKVEGDNHPKLRVTNLNKSLAKNVRIEFPEGNKVLLKPDIDAVFPIPVLNMHKAIDLSIAVYNNSPRKLTVDLIWDDGFQDNNVKTIKASY